MVFEPLVFDRHQMGRTDRGDQKDLQTMVDDQWEKASNTTACERNKDFTNQPRNQLQEGGTYPQIDIQLESVITDGRGGLGSSLICTTLLAGIFCLERSDCFSSTAGGGGCCCGVGGGVCRRIILARYVPIRAEKPIAPANATAMNTNVYIG